VRARVQEDTGATEAKEAIELNNLLLDATYGCW